MKTPDQVKLYECLVDGQWVPVHWEQLDVGDIVRTTGDVLRGLMTDEFRITQLPVIHVDPVTKAL